MRTQLTRPLSWICGVALSVGLKWAFDRTLWDPLTKWLDHIIDFERVALIVAIASYLMPLAAAVLICVKLFPGEAVDHTLPALRKSPWQSKPLIASVLIVLVSVIAGTSYGRLFGLPWVTLPSTHTDANTP
jgi:hypothetical protein